MTLNSIKEKNSSGQFRLTKSGDQCQTFLSQEAFASIWMPKWRFTPPPVYPEVLGDGAREEVGRSQLAASP